MTEETEIEYTNEFIAKLELIFDPGFLSPGGPEEVAKIIEGVSLEGKEVLDIGVGIAGPACMLVKEHGALKVTGIDVENPVLEKATETINYYGVANQVELNLVKPGSLSFADESFDVVFSKDSIIHVTDKAALYEEILRVLRPGGWLLMSDWYGSKDPMTIETKEWLAGTGLSFAMTPIENDAALLKSCGFVEISTTDRNSWFYENVKSSLERLEGIDREKLEKVLGRDRAEKELTQTKRRLTVVGQGQLRPGHLRGQKPL